MWPYAYTNICSLFPVRESCGGFYTQILFSKFDYILEYNHSYLYTCMRAYMHSLRMHMWECIWIGSYIYYAHVDTFMYAYLDVITHAYMVVITRAHMDTLCRRMDTCVHWAYVCISAYVMRLQLCLCMDEVFFPCT